MKKFLTAAALAAAAALSLSGPALANGGIKAGVLTCDISGGIGYIVGSSKSVSCSFKPTGSHRHDVYTGSITKVGADIGVTSGAKMVWLVFAPGRVGKGALAGTYIGATGEATAGIGAGANVLVGGMENGFNLQPVSVQGQVGLNVAGGIAGLRLSAAN